MTENTKHAAMRSVLLHSKRWQDTTSQLDLMKLAHAGPVDMSEWKHSDFTEVWKWAHGDGAEEPPQVLRDYLEKLR